MTTKTYLKATTKKSLKATTKKSLKVTEKFRAEAALYIPSCVKGEGWYETSGSKRGGVVIIQIQENARKNGTPVPVVRFQLRHGQDVMNARILNGLPLQRPNRTTVLFKSASTSTSGVRRKGIHALKFKEADKADDFEMWWYAKNGSLKKWKDPMESAENLKKQNKGSKRKAIDPTNSSFTPSKKKFKLLDQKEPSLEIASSPSNSSKEENGNDDGLKEDSESISSNNEQVFVDYEDAPLSQQGWTSSFDEYDSE